MKKEPYQNKIEKAKDLINKSKPTPNYLKGRDVEGKKTVTDASGKEIEDNAK